MSQVVLHLGDEYIDEDLEYYFSGERDKNNQVRPDEAIYSMTPFAQHIDIDLNDGKVGNFFYPLSPNLLDRIYIGISVSLFANHWGASFLLELLKLVKPGGAIILPVYPEGQAAEKGYWSRSFLENIFLSRSRWRGMSNINAENDGVMSLREGREWPQPIHSSIEWFYRERSNLLLSSLVAKDGSVEAKSYIQNIFTDLCKLIWQEYSSSAALERIISDQYGSNTPITVAHVGSEYGLLLNDLMLSQYVNVQAGTTWHIGEFDPSLMNSVGQYFAPLTKSKHIVQQGQSYHDLFQGVSDVTILSNVFLTAAETEYKKLLELAWSNTAANGLLVVHENLISQPDAINVLDSLIGDKGTIEYYSSIAACKIKPDYEISQYSLAVEENLRQEKDGKANVFRVLRK